MSKINSHKIALFLGIFLLSGQLTAILADNLLNTPGERATNTQQKKIFSPRNYCSTTGGVVSETSDAHIYLCCYIKKNKCLAVDTQQNISWRVSDRDLESFLSQKVIPPIVGTYGGTKNEGV